MAQLPPSAVFGSAHPGQAVHVLLLIENSLPMMDHWQDLQQHILPGVLGAVRLANPGVNVQIFWETTGKTQDQRPARKTQRHFNDFPDIDIVSLPRNKLSPLFIRQSIDLFLSSGDRKIPITRHVFIVAMSNPIDDLPGKSDRPHQPSQVDDAKWDALATRLQESSIVLHVIANPLARLTRIFEVFRKTMRFQSRQEVIPWQPVDSMHCVCHLSGSVKYAERHGRSNEEWPEVHLASAEPSSPAPNSPADMSDEELPSPMSAIDMINSNPGSLSLVSRMQALHGLASRRRPSERTRRPSISRNTFFRETSPTPSPRRERLIHSKNTQGTHANGNGAGKERERLRHLSSVALSPKRSSASFSSALDLRGLTQDPGFHSPIDAQAPYSNGPGDGYAGAGLTVVGPSASPPGMVAAPSPGSDASGSTMSSSQRNADMSANAVTEAVSPRSAYANNRPMQQQPSLYPLEIGGSSQLASYQLLSSPTSPTFAAAGSNASAPVSPTHYQRPTYEPSPQSAYSNPAAPLSTFSSFSPSYPRYANDQPGTSASAYAAAADSVPTNVQLSSIPEDDFEPEVVPASAPPDERGQVPFVFDAIYERQSMVRLREAIGSMQSFSDGCAVGAGVTSDLANESWKGHGNTLTNSYIPELPATFYSVDRGGHDERQGGPYFSSSGNVLLRGHMDLF